MRTIDGLPAQPPDMSDEQYAYAMALAHFETINAELNRRCLDLSEPDDNPYVDGTTANIAYEELKYAEAFNLVVQAEDMLIDWADHQMRRSLGKQRYRQIQAVFDVDRVRNLGMKARLVDMCFKFRAEPKRRSA